MSRSQKLLLSMLGSILLHCWLAVMLLTGLLVPATRATRDEQAVAEPEEVVVMLRDILPDTLDAEREKMFIRTDPDSETGEVPVEPRFESDRNTLAATELLPESKAEARNGLPTIEGREDFPGLELRDRSFSDGDENGDRIELPAPGSPEVTVPENSNEVHAKTADTMAVGSGRVASEATDMPNPEAGSGAAKGIIASSVLAEKLQRPQQDTNEAAVDKVAVDATRNPLQGNVPVVMALDGDRENRDAENDKLMPGGLVGSSVGPKQSTEIAESDSPPAPVPNQKRPAEASSSENPVSGAMPSGSAPASTESETPAFSPETVANHVSGTLSNLGDRASVDAEGTELGRYKQGVVTAIEKSWHRFRLSNRDDVTAGNLRLRFRIDSSGQVRNLKILRNEANIGMTEFTLKAILAADIPAMPRDVAGLLGSDGLVMNYTILVAY